MKNKYIDAMFFGILLCILMSLSFIGPSMVLKMTTTEEIIPESLAFMENYTVSVQKSTFEDPNKMTQHEKNILAKEYHDKFPNLVDAMLNLRSKGFLSYEDILKVHESLANYQANITTEVPYSDKDLLEYLYDNNIITKAQFEQILNIINKDS